MNSTPEASIPRRVMLAAALLVMTVTPVSSGRAFGGDDARVEEVDTRDASHTRPSDARDVTLGWRAALLERADASRRAANITSIEEVPDSSWFTNRLGSRRLGPADIASGADALTVRPSGPWTVIGGKTDGVTPGLRLRDASGRTFFVKFDPRSNPEMASGAEVIATKLLFAAGYWVPENYIVTLRPDDLYLDAEATFHGSDGRARPMTRVDVRNVLAQAARRGDGAYRALASLKVEGRPLGPFRYSGVRPDDPNDVVAHEDRRELRGLRVFAAWLDHVDTKSQNTLDTLVRVGDRQIVRHYLIDFGSTLGSAGTGPKDWRDGYEYGFEARRSLMALLTLGIYTPPWQRIHYPRLPSVGRISDAFDPPAWKPTIPNPAFLRARADDTFWGAERVAAFTDEAIDAVVATAQFSDPRASAYLSSVLKGRRDRIARTWLTNVNPVADPALDSDGHFTFRNRAVDAGAATPPAVYLVRCSRLDGLTGRAVPIERWTRVVDTRRALPRALLSESDRIQVDVLALHGDHPSWGRPVTARFTRGEGGAWRLVGFERLPADE